jgi:hypothetical protein
LEEGGDVGFLVDECEGSDRLVADADFKYFFRDKEGITFWLFDIVIEGVVVVAIGGMRASGRAAATVAADMY